MTSLWNRIEAVLPFVRAPAQYIGGEFNSVVKDDKTRRIRFALAFPDTYAIGMSSLGFQVMYGLLNSRDEVVCERVFAPWLDMESKMREANIPLFTLETTSPVKDFDIIGFSIQSELTYTNLVNMLELAQIPILQNERREEEPLVIAGGMCTFYPEPITDFIDAFIVGDAEEVIFDFLSCYKKLKSAGACKKSILIECAKIQGIYVPSLYEITYKDDGTILSCVAKDGAAEKIERAVVTSLEDTYFPTKPVIPNSEAVHERIELEIMRGCPGNCRFCLATNTKRPVRLRSQEKLCGLAEEIYKNTGYNEISLLSLSSGTYPNVFKLIEKLNSRFKSRGVGISLPSLRADEKLKDIPSMIKAVRKAGLTIAPETGTESLRAFINKPIKDSDILETARAAFENGWRHLKLYFMIGLPRQDIQDIQSMFELTKKISYIGKEVGGNYPNLNVTISPFVPKPHTAFQWYPFADFETLKADISLLLKLTRNTRINLKVHNPQKSFIEAVLSKGSRQVSKVILAAHRRGVKFDEWDEVFNYEKWMSAFKECSISPDFFARRLIPEDEILPWDHISSSVSKDYLLGEFKRTSSNFSSF